MVSCKAVLDYLVLLVSIFGGGAWAIDCYKCVYDGSQSESASVYSAVSWSNKANTAYCGNYWWSEQNAPVETCGFATPRCAIIKYVKSDGHEYVSRGCTNLITCFNSTKSVKVSGTWHEAQYFCCSHSRCNGANRTRGQVTWWILAGAAAMVAAILQVSNK